MSSLTRKGWFICPKDIKDIKDIKENTPLHQVFASERNRFIIEWPKPEEELNLKGNGSAAQQEYLEWAWVKQWDEKLKDDKTRLKDVLNNHPTCGDLLKQIDESRYKLPGKSKKMKSSDFDAVKETVIISLKKK